MIVVSVIIPTYNRPDRVLRTLKSLCAQTLSRDLYQVIVVDDGSSEDICLLESVDLPINYKLLRKNHGGATLARNFGVHKSKGDILVFMDDDVTISPQTLQAFLKVLKTERQIIAMGTLVTRIEEEKTLFAKIMASNVSEGLGKGEMERGDEYVHFTRCNTQLLAVRRTDFYNLGMLQDPTGGWPNWDDVDFGYRAHLNGFRLLRVQKAVGEHWDYSLGSLGSSSQRWFQASKSAARLFQRYPDLEAHIPMYRDKTPIVWKDDNLNLMARKVARRLISTRMSISVLQAVVGFLENHYPRKNLLKPLYRWTQGGYMFQGYRKGLCE